MRPRFSEQALILTPGGRDARIAAAMLGEAGIDATICAGLEGLVAGLEAGSGFALVKEETLATADPRGLSEWIAAQPEWSDFPFVLLTRRGGGLERNPAAGRYLDMLGNVTFLERPFHPTTLVSLAQSALRGRRRQYEARARLEALRESEARFRAMADGAPSPVWVTDRGGIEFVNKAFVAFSGLPQPALMGEVWTSFVHPDDLPGIAERRDAAWKAMEPYEYDARFRRSDGAWRWIHATCNPRIDGTGAFVGYVGIANDVTDSRRVETELREETRLLETLNRISADLAAELDAARVVQLVTDAGVALSGAQFGAFFQNVIDAAGERYTPSAISGADPSAFDNFPMPRKTAVFAPTFEGERVVRSDDITSDPSYGRNAPFGGIPAGHLPVASYLAVPVTSRSGEVIGGLLFGHAEKARFTARHEQLLVGIAGQAAVAIDNARLYEAAQREIGDRRLAEAALLDLNQTLEGRIDAAIAERKQAEEALRQSQKLEAMGQLTGGVAHDFNNLLTPIIGSLDMLQRNRIGNDRERRLIDGALQSAERAKTLVQRLLAFARRQPLQPTAVDVSALVHGMGNLVASTTGPQIQVVVEAPDDLPHANADPNQLEMALLNLSVNARDAMPGGGTLRITVSRELLGPAHASLLPPGDYIRLSVADTGCGMDEATIERAVEPFFSTKGIGKGTGLGLSMVHGLASQLGGALNLSSKPGVGTNIDLWLPVSAATAATDEAPARAAAGVGPQGVALLVDDEELVRASTAHMLEELGYRVIEAASAEEALRIVDAEPGFDLLVTDYLMPGTTGADLARTVMARMPALPVLIVSGYADADGIAPDLPRLTKPFRQDELAAKIAALGTPVS